MQVATTTDHLAALKQQRSDLQAQHGRLDAALGRILGLQREIEAAKAALGEHDADLATSMHAWASAGEDVEAPAGDPEQRHKLTLDIAHAESRLGASQAAHDQLQAERGDVLRQLAEVASKIDAGAREIMLGEHAALVGEIEADLMALRPKVAKALALRMQLVNEAQAHGNAGRVDQQRALLADVERLTPAVEKVNLPDQHIPVPLAIVDAMDAWRVHAGELAR